MEFIHKSKLKFHGDLKPSKCLVDSRLQIKISGFGLWEFKYGGTNEINSQQNTNYEGKSSPLIKHCLKFLFVPKVYLSKSEGLAVMHTRSSELVAAMFWTAPELLRRNSRTCHGTPKGDIYSFAIIMWELMYNSKAGPYQDINLDPKGLIMFFILFSHLFISTTLDQSKSVRSNRLDRPMGVHNSAIKRTLTKV